MPRAAGGERCAKCVPRLVRPTLKLKRQAEKLLVVVNAAETLRNKGGKKKYHRIRQWFTSFM